MKAMIFAAGLGSRLKPWTDSHPKALAMVNGKSLLERNILYLQQYGIKEVVVNVHHFANQIIEAIETNNGWGSTVTISDETDEVLETGGGLKKAAHFFKEEEHMVIMNADILTNMQLDQMIQQHKQTNALATLAVSQRTTSRYFLFGDDSKLKGWKHEGTGEVKPVGLDTNGLHSRAFSGIHVVQQALFAKIKQEGKFSMVDVYLDLCATENIYCFDHTGALLLDVGKPESLTKAASLFFLMNTILHFALIGCGNIATEHATQITRVGKLVAVVDIDNAKAKLLGDLYGVPFFETASALYATVQQLDVVVIATPNGLHATQAIDAMQAGYHVLVEKPIALLTTDIDKMKTVAEQTGKMIFSVMQNRFNPPVKLIHQLLQQQALGSLKYVVVNCFWHRPAAYYTNSWHGTMELDGGTLFTQFSHFIDLLCWLFGPAKVVQAEFKNTHHQSLIDFEDEGKVEIKFLSGLTAYMNYSVNEPITNKEGSLAIFSSKGTIKAGGAYLNTLEFDVDDAALAAELQIQLDAMNKEQYSPNDYGHYKGSMRNHYQVYDSLKNALVNQAPYYTTVEEARNTISLINLIYQAR